MARKMLIQVRRDTAANWTSANPTLAAGEPGYETDTGKFKIGNGSTAWSSLAYFQTGAGGGGGGSASLELDYATRSTDLTVSATTGATADTWITGNAVTYDGTKVYICGYAPFQNATTSAELIIELYDGSTQIGRAFQSDYGGSMYFELAYTPSAASHTFGLRAWRTGSNRTISVATSWIGPCYMKVLATSSVLDGGSP